MGIDGNVIAGAPSRFWDWWTAQLADLTSMMVPARRNADLSVSRSTDGDWIATSNSGDPTVASPLVDLIEPSRNQTVCVRLSKADFFLRRVTLPNVARRELVRLLALDLERATPFKVSDIYSDFVVEAARPRPGFVSVLQVIATRDVIDTMCADIEALGLRVVELNCSDADTALARLNFLTAMATGTSPQNIRSTARWLVPVALLLATTAIAIDVGRYGLARDALVSETAAALALAKARRQSSQAAEAALAHTETIQRRAQARLPQMRVLNELARLLPDTAWLTDLRIDGDTIDISGHAKQAATLVGLFETSSLFSDAELTSAITRIDTLDRERFSLRARIKQLATP